MLGFWRKNAKNSYLFSYEWAPNDTAGIRPEVRNTSNSILGTEFKLRKSHIICPCRKGKKQILSSRRPLTLRKKILITGLVGEGDLFHLISHFESWLLPDYPINQSNKSILICRYCSSYSYNSAWYFWTAEIWAGL